MTSRFERLSTFDRALFILLIIATSSLLLPMSASAQTSNQQPIVFEINSTTKLIIPRDYTAQLASSELPDVDNSQQIFNQNVVILHDYLVKKGSPLADHAATLLAQNNWQLVVAVSNGESTMCKHYKYNNCWGIGGAWNLKRYDNLDDAIVDVNRIISQKYVADGLDTPQKMVHRYVGHTNANWVLAANKILNEISQLPLQTS
ncbi:MAG TPA: hypothetical protein VFX17_02715 [Patescibacteria group bacterium]|nr:hypothetical protein [Patescibacteria group bacterium]